jgi:hypothetical protein
MMNFAILRLRKLKSLVQISAAGRHNSRKGKVPNADPERSPQNLELVPPHSHGIASAFRERLPAKVRKNAVLGIEALFATSSKVSDVDGWAKTSLEWAKARWGADNILSATLHMDEATPHLHCLVLPMQNGKLRGRDMVGNRSTLSEMQDSYHRAVADFGLARGRVGSTRRHIPSHTLRSANASAGERERAEALAEVKLLRSEIASLRSEAQKLKQANARASEARREALRSGVAIAPQNTQPKPKKAYSVPTISEIMARGRGDRGGIE